MEKEHKIVFGKEEQQHMQSGLLVIGFFTTLILPMMTLTDEFSNYSDNILIDAIIIFVGLIFLYTFMCLLVLFIGWIANKVLFNYKEE